MNGSDLSNTDPQKTLLTCSRCKKGNQHKLFNVLGKGTQNKCLECVIGISKELSTESNRDSWIECRICGYRAKEIATHVKNIHGVNPKDYGVTKCKNSIDRVKGENNPGYNHGGRMSAWSRKSTFYSPESHQKAIANSQEGINKNSPVRRAFYETDDDFKRAQTRDLDFFITKYGFEEGTARHAAKTLKWIKSYKKQNFSKISQELFVEIEALYTGNTYFATKIRPEMDGYQNKEFRTELGLLLDYVDANTKRVIEFDGDYWHGKKGNVERERVRDEKLLAAGYKVLHIKESDFRKDKQNTIQRCVQFLTE